ncbi:MAG: arylsulfatase [Opitutus sp.]|nr:arylsulfatase [Opitutus sp.]
MDLRSLLPAVFLSFLCSFALPASGASTARPNIILIVADDLGYSDLGCYGSEIQTPNLDRLAAEGVKFRQFYTYPRCCPTRATVLTGVYPHQAGIGHMVERNGLPVPSHPFPGYKGELSPNVATVAETLRDHGYRTALSGKWHLTPFTESKTNWPLQRGFDEFYGTIHGAGSFYDPVSLVRGNDVIRTPPQPYYYTDAITDHAVATVGKFTSEKKPFFLYVAYTAPHWPMHALPKDIAKYKDKYLIGWDALRAQRHRRQIELGLIDKAWSLPPRDADIPAWETAKNKEWEAHRMAVYAAMIDRMDQGIGKILAQLRSTGAADNTLVVFHSDNGGCAEGSARPPANRSNPPYVPTHAPDGKPVRRGNVPDVVPGPDDTYSTYGRSWAYASNTPFRSFKHWTHEGGIATPFIAHWPAGLKARGITNQIGHIVDLAPTFLELAGAPHPRTYRGRTTVPLEGRSLAPLFGHTAAFRPEHPYFWEHEGNRAVRQGKWKLVAAYEKPWELYDTAADRTELHNLAEKIPGKVRELTALYDAWAARAQVVPWKDYVAELAKHPDAAFAK